ncbi:hypothetical protein [Bilophila wadsworthia]|uniref:hypothetical protein n=1 Tax=Bilophila wadsworthia TaxID=35833 RepID=UPI00302B7C36
MRQDCIPHESEGYADAVAVAAGLARLLADLTDVRGSCAAALATLRQGIDTGNPALLALAGESLSASRLELEWLSGDVSRMADALSPLAGEGEGYAVIPQ